MRSPASFGLLLSFLISAGGVGRSNGSPASFGLLFCLLISTGAVGRSNRSPASLGFLGRLSVYAGAVTSSSSSPAGLPILLCRLSVWSSAGWACASSAPSSAPSSPPTSTSPGSIAIASGEFVTKTCGYHSATTGPSGVFRRLTWTSMRKWNRNVQTEMINIAQQGRHSSGKSPPQFPCRM